MQQHVAMHSLEEAPIRLHTVPRFKSPVAGWKGHLEADVEVVGDAGDLAVLKGVAAVDSAMHATYVVSQHAKAPGGQCRGNW